MKSLIWLWSICQMNYNIRRHNLLVWETHFFDRLISDFSTVLYFLENICKIEDVINEDNFTDSNVFLDKKSWIPEFRKVENKYIKMICVHDFPSNKSYEEYLPIFIDKYRRRLKRFFDLVQNNTKLNFVHVFDHQFMTINLPSIDDLLKFEYYIKKINPSCIFTVNLLVPPKYHHFFEEVNKFSQLSFVMVHKLNIDSQVEENRVNYNYNRTNLFSRITKITKSELIANLNQDM